MRSPRLLWAGSYGLRTVVSLIFTAATSPPLGATLLSSFPSTAACERGSTRMLAQRGRERTTMLAGGGEEQGNPETNMYCDRPRLLPGCFAILSPPLQPPPPSAGASVSYSVASADTRWRTTTFRTLREPNLCHPITDVVRCRQILHSPSFSPPVGLATCSDSSHRCPTCVGSI